MVTVGARIGAAARARLASVRVRSALAAAVVVLAAVGLAGVASVFTARAVLTGNVDAAASQRCGQIVAAIQTGDTTLVEQSVQPTAGDETLVQIVDSSDRVVAASPEVAGRPPISTLRPAVGAIARREQTALGMDKPFRIVATTVATSDGTRTVLVARSLHSVHESVELLSRAAAIGMPILALIVGLATFVFVGRSLRPVDAIRRRVDGITAQDLHARVPVPATRDEVAALADTMNGMLDRLQAASDTQRRFVADASHELRNPVATLQVGLEIMNPATVTADDVALLRGEADRVARLVNDLLLLARADERGLRPRLAEVDLDELAYSSRERLRSRRPELCVQADLHPVRVLGDAQQLERAIANLCHNAARHAYSQVKITVCRDGGAALIRVEDDGPGIPPAHRDRVFDRFVRLGDSRTRNDGGAGLGLAISREIVLGHDGAITVADSPLGGARFDIRLPAGDSSEATDDEKETDANLDR
jgi:signal transduction histidine kinase